jgi:hypothetical protein
MSFSITTAFVQQFKSAIDVLLQQGESRLRDTVTQENPVGEKAFFEQLGLVELSPIITRHGPTSLMSTPHARRMMTSAEFGGADLVDDLDKPDMLIDPAGDYARNFARAAGRTIDRTIITSFKATAKTGKDGTTDVAFPAGNTVAVDFNLPGAVTTSNLTVAKVRRAAELLNIGEVPMEDRYAAISSAQLRSLQQDDEFTSRDFSGMLVPLMTGGLPVQWMGFTWKMTQLLPVVTATNVRSAFFYHKRGIKLGMWKDFTVEIDKRSDLNNSTQVLMKGKLGAMRMQEGMVIEVLCDEDF